MISSVCRGKSRSSSECSSVRTEGSQPPAAAAGPAAAFLEAPYLGSAVAIVSICAAEHGGISGSMGAQIGWAATVAVHAHSEVVLKRAIKLSSVARSIKHGLATLLERRGWAKLNADTCFIRHGTHTENESAWAAVLDDVSDLCFGSLAEVAPAELTRAALWLKTALDLQARLSDPDPKRAAQQRAVMVINGGQEAPPSRVPEPKAT